VDITKDLGRGFKGEEIARRYLKERLCAHSVFHVNGYFPYFDLVAVFPNGRIISYEVKSDFKCAKTGNIALEYEHDGYWTGILKSLSERYLVVLDDELLDMSRVDLFNFINNLDFKRIKGGDNNLSTFILVPHVELVSQEWVSRWYFGEKHEPEFKTPEYLHELVCREACDDS